MDAARAEEADRRMIIAAGSTPSEPRAADLNIVEVAAQADRRSIWGGRAPPSSALAVVRTPSPLGHPGFGYALYEVLAIEQINTTA